MTIVVKDGQTLLDLATQKYGSIEAVFELAKDNGFDNITDDIVAGHLLTIDERKVVKQSIVDYYVDRQIDIVTGSSILTISERVFDESFDETFN